MISAKYAIQIVCRTCEMAQSEDSRVEKLLLHKLQPEETSKAGLVYFATVNPVVREEETTQKMDGFSS